MSQSRFYLDHAATSWPKPTGVLQAAIDFQTDLGVAASRGAYRRAEQTDRAIDAVRVQLGNLIGRSEPDQIAWTSNGTMAIHAAIHSVLWESDLRDQHVVTTATEHNSVLRTLADLELRRGLRWTMVPCDACGRVAPDAIRDAIEPQTRLVIVNHASNVTGIAQDLEAIADVVAHSNAWWMVDGAQSLGYIPVDSRSLGIDLLVAPTHKGLGGLLGTAFVAASQRITPCLRSPWVGGTGRSSMDWKGPFGWRESIESGNLNGPSIASLSPSLELLNPKSLNEFQYRYSHWLERIVDEVRRQKTLRLIGYSSTLDRFAPSARVPVVSFLSQTLSSHEMAMLLDSALGIECRSGLHCAGAIHDYLGSDPKDGTLRMSFGHTSTDSDVEAAVEGIRLLGQVAL